METPGVTSRRHDINLKTTSWHLDLHCCFLLHKVIISKVPCSVPVIATYFQRIAAELHDRPIVVIAADDTSFPQTRSPTSFQQLAVMKWYLS